jgi:Uma2 family endonuclease
MKDAKRTTRGKPPPRYGLPEPTWTVARLSKYFGVPPERLLLHPRPGEATEEDLLYVNDHGNRLCELVDGVLVAKAMGFPEGFLAALLIRLLGNFTAKHDLGIVTAPDATMRLFPGLVRMPDVAFFSWDRLPGGEAPATPIPDLAPDLAVEVISKGNTKKEMDRKIREYFKYGVKLVWLINPQKRMVAVYTSPQDRRLLREDEVLDGADVVPGFSLNLADFFTPPKRRRRA